jgi:hypothetical protein|tara:strand:+ start:41784 stop:42797 length:1014 start_codon:yes stop_codon:yes gene_type:complete
MLSITILMVFCLNPVVAQTVIFTEDFESGAPSADWELYRTGEEAIQAVDMADAPAALANGGSYVGMIWDEDVSYAGSAHAITGDETLQNYTIEADVYCYNNNPNGSAYTGLIVYADSSHEGSADHGFFYKFVADFDADNRFRLYNNQLSGFSYTFVENIPASGYDTAEGWHHMQLQVETVGNETHFTCWYDGQELGQYIDDGVDQHGQGKFGMWSFQNNFGIAGYYDNIIVSTNESSVDEESSIPGTFSLDQNYPNPFNARTTITFDVNEAADIALAIYNVNGQIVRSLAQGKREVGIYSFIWDGKDELGRVAPTGVYTYVVTSGSQQISKKMILLK